LSLASSRPEPPQTVRVYAVDERSGLRDPLDDAMTICNEALALFNGSKVGVGQAEGPDVGDTERLDLRGPSTDAVVLHENHPAALPGQRQPLGVPDALCPFLTVDG